jgi:hemerythrin
MYFSRHVQHSGAVQTHQVLALELVPVMSETIHAAADKIMTTLEMIRMRFFRHHVLKSETTYAKFEKKRMPAAVAIRDAYCLRLPRSYSTASPILVHPLRQKP